MHRSGCFTRRATVAICSKRVALQCSPFGSGRDSFVKAQSVKEAAGAFSNRQKVDLSPVRGTRDVFPEDHRLRSHLFEIWRNVSVLYGFEEYDAPVLENEDLNIRKAGEDVSAQLYNFVDKGDRRVSLRPEMTPSLARMVLSRRKGLRLPIKWFSIPQCWRYERMTRGRRREHYQWNLDIWGIETVEAEAELLGACVDALKAMGLSSSDVGIKISSRKLLQTLMQKHGIADKDSTAVCLLIDKLDKVPVDAVSCSLAELGISHDAIKGLLSDIQVQKRSSASDLSALDFFDPQCLGVRDMKRLFELASAYGYEDWLVFDPCIVRGLSYYTGIVFEGFDREGELRAIFGGGRYDNLLQSMSGSEQSSLPAVGFGFGDTVILELHNSKQLLPDCAVKPAEIVVHAATMQSQKDAIRLAQALRDAGFITELILEDRKLKWVLSHADKLRAPTVVLVDAPETAQVRDMLTGNQETVQSVVNIVHAVRSILSRHKPETREE